MRATGYISYGMIICALGVGLVCAVPASAQNSGFAKKKSKVVDVKVDQNAIPAVSEDKAADNPAPAAVSVEVPVVAAVVAPPSEVIVAPVDVPVVETSVVPVVAPIDVPAVSTEAVVPSVEVPVVEVPVVPVVVAPINVPVVEPVVVGTSQDMSKEMPVAKKSAAKVMGTAQGEANIWSTDPKVSLKGHVRFTETKDGLKVEAEVFGVPGPGEHGFHIHELGSCEEQGKTAGGHYNPMSAQHGFLPKDGAQQAHAGDMGSIVVDESGHGTLTVVLPGVSLSGGSANVDGRAVILHEKADDFSQPAGNAGGRIGCGLISVTSESSK